VETVPLNAIVIFLGGPNDGFIEAGDGAVPYVINMELPKDGEPGSRAGESSPIKGNRSEIGKRWRVGPMYFTDATRKIGAAKAMEILGKYGKQPNLSFYELSEIDGDVYVYRYVGEVEPA